MKKDFVDSSGYHWEFFEGEKEWGEGSSILSKFNKRIR
jgi:hypothetical protein